MSAFSSASSGTLRPRGSRPVAEPWVFAALRLIFTRASGGSVRATISAVIIFVRLAIGLSSCGLRSHRTAPLFTSKSSPATGGCLKR